MTRSFKEIGKSTGTDKVNRHGYHRFYPIFLEKLRGLPITMLEIGTDKNRSLKLWEEYFPLARIYGIDIGNGFELERGEVFKGDQSDDVFLGDVIKKIGTKADLIIDDGSHKPEHQLSTFVRLFEDLLKDGGIYIIEDIETNYWRKGVCYENVIEKGYKHKGSIIEIFKDMIDKVNKEFVKDRSVFDASLIPAEVQDKIGLISFQHNSLIIIKKDEEDKQFENRRYRLSSYL